MKKFLKQNKAITLIALVITIIVLLILAGVSIVTLVENNGILNHSKKTQEKINIEELIETAKLDIINEQIENHGKIEKENIEIVLNKYFKDVPATLPDDISTLKLDAKDEYGGYQNIEISKIYQEVEKEAVAYNPDTLSIGEPVNTDKYGWKVKNYTVKTSEFTTGVWRLFYQDENYAYLITDECIGSYKPIEQYTEKYTSGEEISIEGKKLNEKVSALFTDADKQSAPNILATVWLTDTSDNGPWAQYKNKDAVFAIGSPSVELFAASYNNRSNKGTPINVEVGENGYDINNTGWLENDENNGVYHKTPPSEIWLSSPHMYNLGLCGQRNVFGMFFDFTGIDATINSLFIRPIVCIPTDVFNEKYGTQENLINE